MSDVDVPTVKEVMGAISIGFILLAGICGTISCWSFDPGGALATVFLLGLSAIFFKLAGGSFKKVFRS